MSVCDIEVWQRRPKWWWITREWSSLTIATTLSAGDDVFVQWHCCLCCCCCCCCEAICQFYIHWFVFDVAIITTDRLVGCHNWCIKPVNDTYVAVLVPFQQLLERRCSVPFVQFTFAWLLVFAHHQDPTSSTDCFRCLLKTYLFTRYQCIQRIRGSQRLCTVQIQALTHSPPIRRFSATWNLFAV